MLNKKEYFLTLGLFLLAVIFSSVFTFTNYNNSLDTTSSFTGYSVVENSPIEYNSLSNEIIDINGLKFGFENGKIIINEKRSLSLIVEDGKKKYSFKKPSLNSKKSKNNYKFSIEEEVDDLLIKENLIFNNNQPVKIVHSLKNNQKSRIENITYYYTFDLFEEDNLIVNGSSCDYKGNCTYIGKDRRNRVNFNEEYDFVFDDLIVNNFTLSEIKFQEDKLWLGFSIDVFLESGEEIELDPTFTTNAVDTLSITPVGTDKVIVAWEDVTNSDATYRVYWTNGTPYSAETDMNSTLRWSLYGNHGISVSAFNATHFVACYYNHQSGGDFFFNTRDINGGNYSLMPLGVSSWDGEAACSVSALNSTHFVIGYIHGNADDIETRVYSFTGTPASSVIDADTNAGTGEIGSASVSAFNSTHFVIGWYDNDSSDSRARVYDTLGNLISASFIDTWSGYYSPTVHVSALNSTHFAAVWDDNGVTSTRVSDIFGIMNAVVETDSSNGGTDYTTIATLNSTHYIVGWLDDADDDASIKGITATRVNFTGAIIDVATDAQYDVDLGAKDVATGIQICNNNFVMAWRDNSSSARWGAFFSNGTSWDGKCFAAGPSIEVISPGNSTYRPGTVLFNISVTSDNSTIRNCNYSLNNGVTNSSLSNTSNYWYTSNYFDSGINNVTFFCIDNNSITVNSKVTFTTKLSPVDIDLNGWSYDEADITPLGNDKFVLAYSKGTSAYWYDLYFDIYYTNGTQFGDTVYIGHFGYESPHVQAFNATHFVIGWGTSQGGTGYAWNGDALFSIYNTNFQVISNWTLIEDGTWGEVDISVLNSTHFVAAYNTLGYGGRSHFKVYDSNANVITGDTVVEYNIGEDSSYDMVSVAALNSSHFAQCYFDNKDSPAYNRLFCEVWSMKGVQLGSTVNPDSDVNNYSMAMETSAINSTHYVVSWVDYPSGDNTLAVYDLNGNQNSIFDSDAYVGTGSWDKSSTVGTLNSTHIVSAWTNPNNEFNTTFRVYDSKGNPNTGIINASIDNQGDDSAYHIAGISPVASEVPVTTLGICQDNFIMAWNETSNGEGLVWMGFKPDGTLWDGRCEDITIDIVSPLNGTTSVSTTVWFNATVTSASYSISKCLYSVNGSANYSMSNSGSLWYSSRTLPFGIYNVTFYCNNTNSDWASETSYFWVDTGNSSCTWWYNNAWNYRKNIIIDKDMVNGTQTNFPLFINITDTSLRIYSQSDGDDILFTDVNGCNKLAHEIEYFDKTTGWFVAWVKVPSLSSSSDTIIEMYYSNNLSGNQQNETKVWDSNFVGVWHLVEDPSTAGSYGIKDSTINRNNGTSGGAMTSGDRVLGRAAYAIDFDGSNDMINISDSSSLDLTNLTLEAWMYNRDTATWGTVAAKGATELTLNYLMQPIYEMIIETGYSTSGYARSSSPDYSNNIWYYVTGTADTSTSKLSLFMNASEHVYTTQTWGGNPKTNNDEMIIGWNQPWPDEALNGILDEVRLSNVPRSKGWINTTYMNIAFPSLFYTVGGDEPYGCNYIGSGMWNINCSHNCSIDSNVVMDGSNITIIGAGFTVVNANISNYGNLTIKGVGGNCRVMCRGGGCFRN